MTSGVYQILNTVTGKCYVGSSNDIRRRIKQHRWLLSRGNHHSVRLQNSFDAHGEAAFTFNVLQLCDPASCVAAEQKWIDALNAYAKGYNSRPIADRPIGTQLSYDHKRKISAALVGREKSDRTRKLLSEANSGKTQSQERRNRTGDLHRGKVMPEAAREKIRAARKGAVASPESRARMSAAQKGKVMPKEAVARAWATRKANAAAKKLASLTVSSLAC